MTRHLPRYQVITALLVVCSLLAAAPAAAQYLTFPRVGVSAAEDAYVTELNVEGDELFELHVVLLPREDQSALQEDYGMVHWGVLEACCGGAAQVVDAVYNPALEHEGGVYSGVYSTGEECMDGEAVWLATLILRMTENQPSGRYYVIAGPMSVAQTCGGDDVVLTDLIAHVNYTNDVTPVERSSLSAVKALFE